MTSDCRIFEESHSGTTIKVAQDDSISKLDLSSSREILAVIDNGCNVVLATQLSDHISEAIEVLLPHSAILHSGLLQKIGGTETAVGRCKMISGHVHHSCRDYCTKLAIQSQKFAQENCSSVLTG